MQSLHSDGPTPGRVQAFSANGVGWITLDNPTKHNAISLCMWGALTDALDRFNADPAVRCVVVRGQGDKAFCTGADIGQKQGIDADQAKRDTEMTLGHLRRIREFPKPLLAMIGGYCMGAGVAISLACDIRIAAAGSTFAIPAARLGLAYQYELLKDLTELVGPARAGQIVFTADRLSAERALQIGLVEEVVAAAELHAFTSAMAGRIAANAPLTIAAAKRSIATAVGDPPGRDVSAVKALAWACLASEDFVEGRQAFKEKRLPMFKGR